MKVTVIVPLPACYADRPEAVFTPVAGRSPLLRVVATLTPLAEVVVAAAEPLADAVRAALDGVPSPIVHVVAAAPSAGRAQCVAAGLANVSGPHVLIHDIDWPLFSVAIAEQVLAVLRGGALAAIPVLPVTDSVKTVDSRGVLTGTLDRSDLRTAQCPRGFAVELLAALAPAMAAEGVDELTAAAAAGVDIALVDGDGDAVSGRLPEDARYLDAVIRGGAG